MRAGLLRDRIRIERPVLTKSESGEATTTSYNLVAEVYAQILSRADGSKATEANQVTPSHTYRIVIRYIEDLKETDRVVFGSRILNISSISIVNRKTRTVELICTEYPIK